MTGFGEQNKNKKTKRNNKRKLKGKEYHMQALALHARGDLTNAEAAYRKAIRSEYVHPGILSNLGIICKNSGRTEEALNLFKKAIKIDSSDPDSYTNLGNLYKDRGELDKALVYTRKSIGIKPDCPIAHMNLGGIHRALGNIDQALVCTHKSLDLQPNSASAHMNLGWIYQERGELDKALTFTLSSLKLNPHNPDAHMNLGAIYKELCEFDKALASTIKSLQLRPDNPTAQMNLGGIYKSLDKFEQANNSIQQGLQSKKITFPLALQALDYYDATNQLQKLNQAINQINKSLGYICPPSAIYTARFLYHKKSYKSSLELLKSIDKASISDNFSRIKYYFFRAMAEEKTGDYTEAFEHFKLAQNDNKYKTIKPNNSINEINSYEILLQKIRQQPGNSAYNIRNNNPIFLIGFPRSGTTLLDTILSSHPSIEIAEEKDLLDYVEHIAMKKFKKNIIDFATLEASQLCVLREEYFKRLYSYVNPSAKIVIDKLPLNIVKIPLINILFPNAKVILAIRHPCDSVLSCFQQTFMPNSAMANFTSLPSSINYYIKVMSAWNRYDKELSIDSITTRYEDLIEDFDGTISIILSFLGVGWNDSLKEYKTTAKNRGVINTPSATQVSQPLYKSSIQKWRHYEAQFEEHLPLLHPWIEQWGYTK